MSREGVLSKRGNLVNEIQQTLHPPLCGFPKDHNAFNLLPAWLDLLLYRKLQTRAAYSRAMFSPFNTVKISWYVGKPLHRFLGSSWIYFTWLASVNGICGTVYKRGENIALGSCCFLGFSASLSVYIDFAESHRMKIPADNAFERCRLKHMFRTGIWICIGVRVNADAWYLMHSNQILRTEIETQYRYINQ